MENELDDVTAAAINEETAGPQTTIAPEPEKTADAPVEETPPAAAPVKDEFVGDFGEPDYLDIISDRDRSEEVQEETVEARPLDPAQPGSIPAEAPVAPVAPVVPTPTSVPQSVETPIAAAPVAPAPVAPVVETPAAPTPGVTVSPEEQAAAYELVQKEVLGKLVEKYKLSPEEAAKLDEFEQKPSEYLPMLLAKAHLNAYADPQRAIMEALPSMVTQISSQKIAEEKAENAFFSRWPELKGQDEVVMRAIRTYGSMNPQASMEEKIERAGMLAMISIGKMPGSSQQQPTVPDVPQVPPARPVLPGGGGGFQQGRPVSYEEAVFDEIIRDERNFGRG